MTLEARRKTVQAFATSGVDGPRVLLVSNVGGVGLNLQCANIVIFLVRLPLLSH